jgi:hypothetical protein
MWDVWWKKWHWDRFLSKFFSFTLSVSFNHGSIFTYLGEEQQVPWWPKFRDIVSPH